MATVVRLTMDPADRILLRRSIGKNGKAALFLATEIKRISGPYVPHLDGDLENTAVATPGKITYGQPYARKQWYENRGNGLRGKQWVPRAWAARGPEVVRAVANYVGGRSG